VYAFILAVAVTNIAGGIGNGELYQFHLGVAHILLVWMFVIIDLRNGIIERQDDLMESYRGGLNA